MEPEPELELVKKSEPESEPLLITVPEPELDINYVFDYLHLTFFSIIFYNKFLFPCKTAFYAKKQKISRIFVENLLFIV